MANKISDIKTAFEWIATNLKDVKHLDNSKKRFYTYDIEDMFKSIKSTDTDPKSMSLYLEEPEISHGGNADNNLHQHWPLTFMLLKFVPAGDLAAQEAAKEACLKSCYKVLARFKKWRHEPSMMPTDFASDNLWRDLHLETTVITFVKNIWDGRYGIRCTFELREPIQGQLEIDNDDWL